MNQFLVGLVERATLRAPILEHRPRSLFEPTAPAVAGPAAVSDPELAGLDDLDGSVDPARGNDASSQSRGELMAGGDPGTGSTRIEGSPAAGATPRPGSWTVPGSRLARHAGDESRFSTPPSSAARHAVDEPQPGSAALSPHGTLEAAAGLDATLAAAPRLEHPRRDQGPRARLRAPVPVQPYAPVPGGDVVHGPPRAPSARPAAAGSAAAAVRPIRSDGTPATDLPMLRAGSRVPGPPAVLVRSQAGPRGLRADGGAAPPLAPVQVTIGRIEVRASPPAANRPPVRRPPAGPKLSLDDYLKGRRGGSR